MMNEGPLLLSPTFPPPVSMGGGFGGFDNRARKNLMRKTVDYQASTLRYLEVRIIYHYDFIISCYLCYRVEFGKETSEIFLFCNQTLPTLMTYVVWCALIRLITT